MGPFAGVEQAHTRNAVALSQPGLTEFVNVACELALEVSSLVLREGLLCGELVEHLCQADKSCRSLCLVSHLAQTADCVACCLCIIAVAQTARFGLPNSFE